MTKIAVFHDHFMYRWWWERLITLLAKSLDADLISAFFDEWSLDPRELWFTWKLVELSKPWFTFFDKKSYQAEKKWKDKLNKAKLIFMKWIRHFLLKYAIIFKSKILSQYDIVIFSWDALWAIRNCRKDTKIFYYCHTPPRYLFDQKEEYRAKVPWILKPLYDFACFIFKKLYIKDFNKVWEIITNSKTVQNRIKTYLSKDAEIIYPPVDISFFRPSPERKDYYYSWARLTEIKRVHIIAEAFKKMPEKNLIISYWKNDPDKVKISEMVKWYQNIKMIESPDDDNLRKLISESIATIYIPREEDFWMSPVESMACWVPVIGVDEWWLKESIIPWKTWILIPAWAKVDNLISAVNDLSLDKALLMKDDCIVQAEKFSLTSFEENIRRKIFHQ